MIMVDNKFKVLITTSGIGSRLGELTDYTNKSLVRIGDKPAISLIIEKYPEDTEFVITLGHYGDYVKEFLRMVYPNRVFLLCRWVTMMALDLAWDTPSCKQKRVSNVHSYLMHVIPYLKQERSLINASGPLGIFCVGEKKGGLITIRYYVV